MPELSDEELDVLIEEATVDAHGDEQLAGFAVMIEGNLKAAGHSGCTPRT